MITKPMKTLEWNYPMTQFLIISVIPLPGVIVLTMKTKFTIPMLQRALRLKKSKSKEREVKHF